MDQPRSRPSRPRLRMHGNSARVLIFDQVESEQSGTNMESEIPRRIIQTSKIESKEAPVRPGLFFIRLPIGKIPLKYNKKIFSTKKNIAVLYSVNHIIFFLYASKILPFFLVSSELSNLVRMRNSAIGKSAPSLSIHVVYILVFNYYKKLIELLN